MVTLIQLHPYDIGVFHEKIRIFISDALGFANDEMSVDDVIQELKVGELGGFGVFDRDGNLVGFLSVKVVTYPSKKMFRIVTMGGLRVDLWERVEPLVIQTAAQYECVGLEFWCRPGVAKVTRDRFKCIEQYTILVRNI